MAGDWIPIRCNLPDDPAVIAIAGCAGLDEFATVGRLVKLWGWANEHLADGNATGDAASVTETWLDRYVGAPGFAAAMIGAGWLVRVGSGPAARVAFPKFDRWNSQGAKRRVLTNRRMAAHRNKSDATGDAASVTSSVTSSVTEASTREEKRREEKREKQTPPYPPQPGGCSTGASEAGKNAGKKTRERKPKADEPGPESVAVPPALDTPTFRAAWSAFLAHRAAMPKAKRLTANAAAIALAKLLPFGPAAAAEKCERSVMNGWTGVVFPGDEPPRATPTTPSATGPPVAPTMQKTGVAARIAALHEARKAAATQAASDPCQTMPTSAPTGSPPGLPTSPSHSGPGPTSQT